MSVCAYACVCVSVSVCGGGVDVCRTGSESFAADHPVGQSAVQLFAIIQNLVLCVYIV